MRTSASIVVFRSCRTLVLMSIDFNILNHVVAKMIALNDLKYFIKLAMSALASEEISSVSSISSIAFRTEGNFWHTGCTALILADHLI